LYWAHIVSVSKARGTGSCITGLTLHKARLHTTSEL